MLRSPFARATLLLLLFAGSASTAAAQRETFRPTPTTTTQRSGISPGSLRGSTTTGTSVRQGSSSTALGRGPVTGRRVGAVAGLDARLAPRQAMITRALRVLGNERASAGQRRAAGVRASVAYRQIGRTLEQRGDRAGAIRAYANAASSRWGRNDADMRFRSEMWERQGELLSESGDHEGAAESYRRAGESLERVGTERDQVRAAALFRQEAILHEARGNPRGRADALVSVSEAWRRAGHIVTASHQAFDRGAPSTWPESEHVLRARAHDHYVAAGSARDEAKVDYRTAGLSWWSARSATNNPRSQLPDPAPPSAP